VNAFHIRSRCRLCSAQLPEERILDLGETALANELKSTRAESLTQDKFPLYLVQCKACGHVQLPVVVDPERLFPADYPYESGTTETFRDHLWRQAQWLDDLLPRHARVLEIGSNDGTLLGYLRKLGHYVVGIDPAEGVATKARDAGIPTEIAHFSFGVACRLAATYGPFDLVVANNVFAHVDDLSSFTEGVAHVLKPGGAFVFEVGYFPRVCERGLLGTCYHEHLSCHSLRPLIPFLKARGLYVEHAREIDSQGGSLRALARKPTDGDLAGRWSLPTWQPRAVVEQLDRDLYDPLALDDHRRDLVAKTCVVLDALLAGKRVCGYGAPAKLTTLLAATGLGADELECVFDDNPRKVGKYTPGTGVPIVASSDLAERKPDVLVCFSSNFIDEIKRKHPDFAGEWVVL
jgi:SAM-dependent methyltransferase